MPHKLTIDMNLVNATESSAMTTLKRWKDEGNVDLIEADPPKVVKPEPYNWPGAPPKVEPAQTTPWGGKRKKRPDTSESHGKANFQNIASVLFPDKDPRKLNIAEINNVAHLIRHHHSQNEIFVTENTRDFINNGRRERLKAYFGIVAMTPDETVRTLGESEGWLSKAVSSGRSRTSAKSK